MLLYPFHAPTVIAGLRELGVAVTDDADLDEMRECLQARVVRLVTSPRDAFDRALFDRLMGLWVALQSVREDASDAV